MADALRGSMDAAEYKHVVLGLLFLKYVSDAFQEAHAELETQLDDGADPEDPDEYIAEGVFWVPEGARWEYLKSQARGDDDRVACGQRDERDRGCQLVVEGCVAEGLRVAVSR